MKKINRSRINSDNYNIKIKINEILKNNKKNNLPKYGLTITSNQFNKKFIINKKNKFSSKFLKNSLTYRNKFIKKKTVIQ